MAITPFVPSSPPSFSDGLAWLLYFCVVAGTLGLILRKRVAALTYEQRRDGRTVCAIIGTYITTLLFARIAQSQMMYGSIFREGYWLPVWSLTAVAVFSLALTWHTRKPDREDDVPAAPPARRFDRRRWPR